MTADEKRSAKSAYMREYWAKNPEHRQKQIDRVKEIVRDPERWAKMRLRTLKCRAKKRGWAFNITEEDLPLPEACPVLGIPLILGVPATNPHSPQVDRIDSKLGYIKGNVRVISGRANYIKKDATFDEIAALYNFMKANQWQTTSPCAASALSEL